MWREIARVFSDLDPANILVFAAHAPPPQLRFQDPTPESKSRRGIGAKGNGATVQSRDPNSAATRGRRRSRDPTQPGIVQLSSGFLPHTKPTRHRVPPQLPGGRKPDHRSFPILAINRDLNSVQEMAFTLSESSSFARLRISRSHSSSASGSIAESSESRRESTKAARASMGNASASRRISTALRLML
jgi:hypothetical protein